MYLGTRRVRSAGRTSGSIEVTLPTQLQSLEGVRCRLVVRDGPRPEVVLQPDLTTAQTLFRTLWQRLRLGLGGIGDIGEFSTADFTLTFFPPAHWQERPPLAYADALRVLRQPPTEARDDTEALARLLAFLAVAASQRLGLSGALALAYGDAVAYLATGSSVGLGTDFERGMAHRLCWSDGRPWPCAGAPGDEDAWERARPGLRQLYEQFQTWQENPDLYAATREKWYRALALEMEMPKEM